jgi:hypothetical protein
MFQRFLPRGGREHRPQRTARVEVVGGTRFRRGRSPYYSIGRDSNRCRINWLGVVGGAERKPHREEFPPILRGGLPALHGDAALLASDDGFRVADNRATHVDLETLSCPPLCTALDDRDPPLTSPSRGPIPWPPCGCHASQGSRCGRDPTADRRKGVLLRLAELAGVVRIGVVWAARGRAVRRPLGSTAHGPAQPEAPHLFVERGRRNAQQPGGQELIHATGL